MARKREAWHQSAGDFVVIRLSRWACDALASQDGLPAGAARRTVSTSAGSGPRRDSPEGWKPP